MIRMWSLLGPTRGRMISAMLARLGQSFCLGLGFGATLWVLQRLLTDQALSNGFILQIALLMLVSLLGQILFSYLTVGRAWTASFESCTDLRLAVLDHMRALPLGYHKSRAKGDLANLVTVDIAMIEGFLSDAMPRAVQALGLPLAVLLVVGFENAALAMAMAASIFLALPVLLLANARLSRLGRLRQDQQGEASAGMVEFVLGLKEIRTFGREDAGSQRFHQAVDGFRDISIRLVKDLVTPLMGFITILMLGVPFVWLFTGLNLAELSPEAVSAALVLSFAAYSPVIALVSISEMARLAEASFNRVSQLLQQEAEPVRNTDSTPRGFAISCDNIGFDYGDGVVLSDVSFQVPERAMIAIVGPSGSGKSTILNLLARFWPTSSGEIQIGGVGLSDLDGSTHSDLISLVAQDVHLFSGSIAQNIAIGRASANRSEIETAARAAQAHEFISALPDGYETEVGEGGLRLSGGERQRIAIARAILKDAPIVLLDEATAALDPSNERALQQALQTLTTNRSVIMVAHRLATVESADEILVLEAGRIVERGTHQSLLNRNGTYARLHARKSRAAGWTLNTKNGVTGDVNA